MIVNEINEAKLSDSKTIDTETDVFLKLAGGSAREHIEKLLIVDGDTNITIDTEFSDKLYKEKGRYEISRETRNASFVGTPKRSNYLDLIERLLYTHGW